jgi:hypothetical protein
MSGFQAEERREAPPKERGREEGGEEPFEDFSRRPASRREQNRIGLTLGTPRQRARAVVLRSTYDTASASEFHSFFRAFPEAGKTSK